MALFKVLRGSSDDFHNDLSLFHNWTADGSATLISNGAITLSPKFNDGFCYFLKDTRMFYIDYAVKDANGNIMERHRVPLNADDALSLTGAILNREEINPSADEIPSSEVISVRFAGVDSDLSDLNKYCDDLNSLKMNKLNPTGTGSFSMNGGSATGTNSFAWGDDEKAPDLTEATGLNAFAMGLGSIASGSLSFSRGEYCIASGAYSSADGNAVEATATYAHAEGNHTTASGQGAHVEGEYGIASGKDSHAEGSYTKAQGDYSHSEGYNTTATHKAQHVEGEWNELDPSTNTSANRGVYVHITGIGTSNNNRKNGFTVDWNGNLWGARSLGHGNTVSASGDNSYAGGLNVIASGISSHAEGSNNVASGFSSHVEGDSSSASGDYSHAGGEKATAQGIRSFAHGLSVTANGVNQAVFGAYNVADTTSLFIVGNGTSTTAKNIFSIGADGKTYFANMSSGIKNQILKAVSGQLELSTETLGSDDSPLYLNSGVLTATTKKFSDYLPLAGGNMTGHIYLTGSNASSSTGNTSQIVFGTSSNNHVAISSNNNALVINPTTTSTANQIVLYLETQSVFPNGIRSSGNINAAKFIGPLEGNVTGHATSASSIINSFDRDTSNYKDAIVLNKADKSTILQYIGMHNVGGIIINPNYNGTADRWSTAYGLHVGASALKFNGKDIATKEYVDSQATGSSVILYRITG